MCSKQFVNIITPKGLIMTTYKKWTNTELDFIRNNHASMPDKELAIKLSQIISENISTSMIRRQRRKLKLRKPKGRPSKEIKILPEDVSEQNQKTSNLG
jgi:hypothetical protein